MKTKKYIIKQNEKYFEDICNFIINNRTNKKICIYFFIGAGFVDYVFKTKDLNWDFIAKKEILGDLELAKLEKYKPINSNFDYLTIINKEKYKNEILKINSKNEFKNLELKWLVNHLKNIVQNNIKIKFITTNHCKTIDKYFLTKNQFTSNDIENKKISTNDDWYSLKLHLVEENYAINWDDYFKILFEKKILNSFKKYIENEKKEYSTNIFISFGSSLNETHIVSMLNFFNDDENKFIVFRKKPTIIKNMNIYTSWISKKEDSKIMDVLVESHDDWDELFKNFSEILRFVIDQSKMSILEKKLFNEPDIEKITIEKINNLLEKDDNVIIKFLNSKEFKNLEKEEKDHFFNSFSWFAFYKIRKELLFFLIKKCNKMDYILFNFYRYKPNLFPVQSFVIWKYIDENKYKIDVKNKFLLNFILSIDIKKINNNSIKKIQKYFIEITINNINEYRSLFQNPLQTNMKNIKDLFEKELLSENDLIKIFKKYKNNDKLIKTLLFFYSITSDLKWKANFLWIFQEVFGYSSKFDILSNKLFTINKKMIEIFCNEKQVSFNEIHKYINNHKEIFKEENKFEILTCNIRKIVDKLMKIKPKNKKIKNLHIKICKDLTFCDIEYLKNVESFYYEKQKTEKDFEKFLNKYKEIKDFSKFLDPIIIYWYKKSFNKIDCLNFVYKKINFLLNKENVLSLLDYFINNKENIKIFLESNIIKYSLLSSIVEVFLGSFDKLKNNSKKLEMFLNLFCYNDKDFRMSNTSLFKKEENEIIKMIVFLWNDKCLNIIKLIFSQFESNSENFIFFMFFKINNFEFVSKCSNIIKNVLKELGKIAEKNKFISAIFKKDEEIFKNIYLNKIEKINKKYVYFFILINYENSKNILDKDKKILDENICEILKFLDEYNKKIKEPFIKESIVLFFEDYLLNLLKIFGEKKMCDFLFRKSTQEFIKTNDMLVVFLKSLFFLINNENGRLLKTKAIKTINKWLEIDNNINKLFEKLCLNIFFFKEIDDYKYIYKTFETYFSLISKLDINIKINDDFYESLFYNEYNHYNTILIKLIFIKFIYKINKRKNEYLNVVLKSYSKKIEIKKLEQMKFEDILTFIKKIKNN